VLTAALAQAARSADARIGWRLAAWLSSLAMFVSHVAYERVRLGRTTPTAAKRSAAAVALGAAILALAGPVRSHWGSAESLRVSILALVLWPIITGVPAFLVALAAAAAYGRIAGAGRHDGRNAPVRR
jgi:hypothetical protein